MSASYSLYPITPAVMPVKIKKSELSNALQWGDLEEIQKIIEETQRDKKSLTLNEEWQVKILYNIDFKNEDFLELSSDIKELVYRTANNLNKFALVTRLNTLGMTIEPLQTDNLCVISEYMDSAAVNNALFNFLMKLRKDGRLLTLEEAQKQGLDDGSTYIKKKYFSRMFGCERLNTVIDFLDLKHIKVPEKKAVLDIDHYSSPVDKFTLLLTPGEKVPENGNCLIYAKKIEKSNRFISREEMSELFLIIDNSKYCDLWPENIVVAIDGIYLIDLEAKSFSNPVEWEKMRRFLPLIAVEDQIWLEEQIQEKLKDKRPFINIQTCFHRYLKWKYSPGLNEKGPNQSLRLSRKSKQLRYLAF